MPLVVFDGLSIQYSGLRSSIIDHEKDELQMAPFRGGGVRAQRRHATAYLLLHRQAVLFHK